MSEPACRDCRFYVEVQGKRIGCRRFPPSPVYASGEPLLTRYPSVWPFVYPEDWCGEFSQRDPEKK